MLPIVKAGSPFANVLRNRYLWAGFAVAFAWGCVKGWHFYNPQAPDLAVRIPLGQYITDPNWGTAWQIDFTVSVVFLSLCMFFELNVLASVVLCIADRGVG